MTTVDPPRCFCGLALVDQQSTTGQLVCPVHCSKCGHDRKSEDYLDFCSECDSDSPRGPCAHAESPIPTASSTTVSGAPDVVDVTGQLRAAIDAVLDYLQDGTGSVEDRIRLHALLRDAGGNLGTINQARMALAESLAGDLDPELATVVDGRVWRPSTERYNRKPDHAWLRSQIGRVISGPIGWDPQTGEAIYPTEEQKLAAMWEFVEPALGRTGVYRKAGIDLRNAYEETGERADVKES